MKTYIIQIAISHGMQNYYSGKEVNANSIMEAIKIVRKEGCGVEGAYWFISNIWHE